MSLILGFVPLMASGSYAVKIPKTLHAALGFGGDGGVSLKKALPIEATDLGVKWLGSGPPPKMRTSKDGRRWSTWRQLTDSEDMYDETTGTHYSALTPGAGARWAQLWPGKGIDAKSLVLQIINTQDGPKRTVRLLKGAWAATGQPAVIPRAAWGADESMRKGSPGFSRVKKLFVHHTVTSNNDADPAATIRAMYSYHVKIRGWEDIGYNFLVDPKGNVYEGRYSRPYPAGEAPSAENPNGSGVIGSQVAGHNVGSMGVAVLGNSNTAAPTPGAMDSLTALLAWKADRHGINPLANDPFTATSGAVSRFPNIAGHRDAPTAETGCPGSRLTGMLPSLRGQSEARIVQASPAGPPHMPTGTVLSPGSPSADATPQVTGAASRSAVRVDLNFTGKRLGSNRTVSVTPSGGSFAVTDSSYNGAALAADTYSVRAVAYDALGRASTAAPVADGYTVTGTPGLLPSLPIIGDGGLPPPLDQANSLLDGVKGLLKGLGL